MQTSYRNAMRRERTLSAELSGQCFNASVRQLLASSSPSEEMAASVLYHAACCKRACSSETYAYVEEIITALEALGRLPKSVTVRSVNL
jgi:hypothetical protein